VPAHDGERGRSDHTARRRPERRDTGGRGVLAALLGDRDPPYRARRSSRIARCAADDHRHAASGAARARTAARVHASARVAAGRRRAVRRVPHPQRARDPRSMIVLIAGLGGAALVAFAVRKRLELAGPITMASLAIAIWYVVSSPPETSEVLGLQLRVSPLAQLGGPILLASLALLVLTVWLDEPAYNFFPTALASAAAVPCVLTLTSPIPIHATLLLALLN